MKVTTVVPDHSTSEHAATPARGAASAAVEALTVWDSAASPSGRNGLVYRWNGHADEASAHSLLRYVERHEEQLRRKYLAWIHDLGESRVDGRRMIDHLAFDDGLSYWWLTRLAEKSPYRSPITDAIRLLALEEIVVQSRPRSIRLVSGNPMLNETVRGLCRSLGIPYAWECVAGKPREPWDLRRVYRVLPQPVKALGTLVRHLVGRWPLRHAGSARWFCGDRALFFCSYFTGTAPEAAADGRFASRYWEGVPDLIARLGLSGNWLHHYFPDATVSTPRVALDWAGRFNRNRREQGFHTFVDAYLSPRIVCRVVTRWFNLMLLSRRLRGIEHAFCPSGSQISLWPLMRSEWYASLRGAAAIQNLLFVELFDAALRDLPHQVKGLYLCENQPWERALTHAWHKHGHGQLIAAAVHVSVRFWDLRYYVDPRTVRSSDPHAMPQPDVLALNGKAAIEACRSVDYPQEAIVECEALRYGRLGDRAENAPGAAEEGPIKVLLLGDYLPSSTVNMLRLLEASAPQLAGRVSYSIKPHPSFPVTASDYPTLHLDIVTDPLATLVRRFDVALSSNMTSAAFDVYFAGVPVVVKLDDAELNMSPLRGQPGVRFVSTVDEVVEALQAPNRRRQPNRTRDEFFFIDPELPRWERLLSYAGGTS